MIVNPPVVVLVATNWRTGMSLGVSTCVGGCGFCELFFLVGFLVLGGGVGVDGFERRQISGV
jgi:hypothetical protein